MTAHCCRIRIRIQEVDEPRLEEALRGIFQFPALEIKFAFALVVRDVPADLDQKMGATTNLAGAIHLLRSYRKRLEESPRTLPSMRQSTEKAALIRNVACFCRKPTEA